MSHTDEFAEQSTSPATLPFYRTVSLRNLPFYRTVSLRNLSFDRTVRLRTFLPIIFCLLIGLVSFLIIFITNRAATQSIGTLAEEVMTRVSQRVVDKTSSYLDATANAVGMNATVWQRGPTGSPGEERAFLEFFNRTSREQLNLYPYFGLVYYGDEQGNHWLNKREQDGTIHVRVITRKDDSPASKEALTRWAAHPKATEEDRQAIAAGLAPLIETYWYEQNEQGRLERGEHDPLKNYDTRLRPWYKGAKSTQKLFWTDVYGWEEKYKGVVSRQVGITVSAPTMRGGKLIGVCGIDISLQAISNFLRDMEIMKHGQAFILNAKGETVGLPDYTEVLAESAAPGDAVRLNHISKISDSFVTASYVAMRHALNLTDEQPFVLNKEQVVTFAVGDQNYYGFYKPFAAELGLNWTVGVVIPEDDFLGNIKEEMQRSLLVALLSMCVMIVAGVVIGRMITNPLAHLGEDVERIMELDLAPTPSLTTRFHEFGMISLAFARMKLALADMVNSLSVHTKTLDWSADEFSNMALTLDDGTQNMQEGIQVIQTAIQQLSDETPAKAEIIQGMGQLEESLLVLKELSQPVVARVEEMNTSSHALRKTLQSVRI